MAELKIFTNFKNEKTKLLKRNSITKYSFLSIYSGLALVLVWIVLGKNLQVKQLLRVTGSLSLGLEVMVLTVCVAVPGLVLPFQ